MNNLDLLNLGEQYHWSNSKDEKVFVFPNTTEYQDLRYLLSLDYICVVSGLFDSITGNGKVRGIIYIYSIEQLDSYKTIYQELELRPVPRQTKERVIRSASWERI